FLLRSGRHSRRRAIVGSIPTRLATVGRRASLGNHRRAAVLIFHFAVIEAHSRIVVEWERASICLWVWLWSSTQYRTDYRGKKMKVEALIIWLIVGAVAGWLAGMVVKGGSYGLIGSIIVGIIGGFIAGWLLPRIGVVIGGGVIGSIINAFIGAVILLVI